MSAVPDTTTLQARWTLLRFLNGFRVTRVRGKPLVYLDNAATTQSRAQSSMR